MAAAPNKLGQKEPFPISSSDEIRKNYLIQYRNGLWTQIRAKEDAIWRFISFFAGALILVTGFLKPDQKSNLLPPYIVMLIIFTIMVVAIWGILLTLDSNFWMQQNLIIVSNIEKDLLNKDDFGKILPASYADVSKFRIAVSYFIQLIFFIITFIIGLLVFLAYSITYSHYGSGILILVSQLISLTLNSLLFYLVFRNKKWVNEFFEVRSYAPGKKIDDQKDFNKELMGVISYVENNFEDLLIFIVIISSFSFSFSSLVLQYRYHFLEFVYYLPILVCTLFLLLTLLLRLRSKITSHKINNFDRAEKERIVSRETKTQRFIFGVLISSYLIVFTTNIWFILVVLIEKFPLLNHLLVF